MVAVTHTDELKAIVEHVATLKEGLIIDALAGTGKTTAVIELLKVIPQRTILLTAFNKRLADELKIRLPKMSPTHAIHVKTFHALGLGILSAHYPGLQVDKSATETLVSSVAPKLGYQVRRATVNLLRLAKEVLPDPKSAMLLELGFKHGILTDKLTAREIETVLDVVRAAWDAGKQLAKRETIDFCDMVWAPNTLGLEPKSRYQAVIVDELQDISRPQFTLLRSVMLPTTRFIATGDRRQQIYGFRESLGAMAWVEAQKLGATALPLTMSWRCSKEVAKLARGLVPAFKAHPDAPDGQVLTCTLGDMPAMIAQNHGTERIHTFVLSRDNVALLDVALFLWSWKVEFQLNAAQDLLEPLFVLLDRELNLTSKDKFSHSVTTWWGAERAKADAAGQTARIEWLDEAKAMLMLACRSVEPREIKRLFNSILTPNRSGVLLSTVHRVKGLEADNVFLMQHTFARHHKRDDRDTEPSQDELNIEYVAITRARDNVIWVDVVSRTATAESFGMLTDAQALKLGRAKLHTLLQQCEAQAGLVLRRGARDAEAHAERLMASSVRIRGLLSQSGGH